MAKKGAKLRTVYGVFFALLTLFVGALFIMQTWSIYRSADRKPYTVESISAHFNQIAIPVWVWIGGLAVSVLLAFLFPSEKKRVKAAVDEKKTLARVQAKLPTEGELFEKAYEVAKGKRLFRAVVATFTTVFMLAAASLCVLTLLGIYHRPLFEKPFFQKQSALVDKISQTAILSLLALLVASIAVGICTASRKREQKKYLALIAESKRTPVVEEKQAEVVPEKAPAPTWETVLHSIIAKEYFHEAKTDEEITALILKVLGEGTDEPQPVEVVEKTQAPVKAKKPLVKAKKERKAHPKARKTGVVLVRVALAAAGIALIVFGVFNGGMKDVLMKAINICTQCIGLG